MIYSFHTPEDMPSLLSECPKPFLIASWHQNLTNISRVRLKSSALFSARYLKYKFFAISLNSGIGQNYRRNMNLYRRGSWITILALSATKSPLLCVDALVLFFHWCIPPLHICTAYEALTIYLFRLLQLHYHRLPLIDVPHLVVSQTWMQSVQMDQGNCRYCIIANSLFSFLC